MHSAPRLRRSQAVRRAQQSERPVARSSWAVLALVAVAQFMVILDITVVNVALPSIGESLGVGRGDLEWVVTAYVLFTGGLLMLGGRAADLLGRRRVFIAGLALFTAASLASGLAGTSGALIVARAVQGVGAALLTPSALSIIATTYHGAQRTTALSIWGVIGSAGAAAGLLFGGMMTTWLSWEWVFLINVPVGIAVGVLTLRHVPSAPPSVSWRKELDVAGGLTVMAGLFAVVFAIAGADSNGWGSARTLALLGAGAVLLAAFALIERAAPRPLIPVQTWANGPLTLSSAAMLGASGILIGTFFLNSLYVQEVLSASALETGFSFLPLALAIGLAAHLAASLLAHAGTRAAVSVGLLLMAVGTMLFVLAPDRASYVADLLPGLVVVGLGAGLVFPAVSVTSMHAASSGSAGVASGVISTAHEIGAALGVSILAAVAAAATGGDFTAGYSSAFTAAAIGATGFGLLAIVRFPTIRPPAGTRVGFH